MVGIIIQARMGSSRLPGKILKDFEGRTLLGHIIDRLKRLEYPAKTVIATSILKQDDIVVDFCENENVACFRGSELNVLERYVKAAEEYGFQHIVRMTGDNPFPDVEELDRLINFHIMGKFDFSENFSTLPIGVGMEIMTMEALRKSLLKASLPKHFEHADEYILDNLDKFSYGILKPAQGKSYTEERLTVDTPEDYEKAAYILREAAGQYVTTELAVKLSKKYIERRDNS